MHPELDIHVRETLTPKLIAELAEGRARHSNCCSAGVRNLRWSRSRAVFRHFLLVRPGDDEERRVPSSKTLRAMRLLLLEEGHCFRDQALSFCNMQSSSPGRCWDASSLSTLVQMVSAGIGVNLIPEWPWRWRHARRQCQSPRFKNPQPSRTIGMVWRKTSPLVRQLLQFSEVVRLSAGALRSSTIRDRHIAQKQQIRQRRFPPTGVCVVLRPDMPVGASRAATRAPPPVARFSAANNVTQA